MKKAIILCSLDGFANSIKPSRTQDFLAARGYEVQLYSTSKLNRLGEKGFKKLLPYPGAKYMALYFLEGLYVVASWQKSKAIKRLVNGAVLGGILRLRGAILAKELKKEKIDLLVCINNFDEAVVFDRVARVQVLDLPTPFAEELFYGGEIGEGSFKKLKKFEQEVYRKADHISFHWYTYIDYVKKHKYDGNNFINLSWGADEKSEHAHYSKTPRVAFIGFLGGYWSNIPLLEQLSSIYPDIDVYGGPAMPDLKVHYMGQTATSDVLKDYQFGLITITDDELRRVGFSAKHLDYFSYGLPVLVPEWRKDSALEGGSIYYNKDNFLSVIREYSDPVKWEEKSKAALAIAHARNWEKVLSPLATLIDL